MNEQEGDFNVYGYSPNPIFMEITEAYETDKNIGVAFGDDDHDTGNARRNVRHTPQQIQELENFYKECPHPSEEQNLEVGRKRTLETNQVSCWIQDKGTQGNANGERHENITLKQENDLMRAEQEQLKQLLSRFSCSNCDGTSNFGVVNNVVQQLRDENAKLKQERDRAKSLVRTPIQLPVSPYAQPCSPLVIPDLETDATPTVESLLNDLETDATPTVESLLNNLETDATPTVESLLNDLLASPSEMPPCSSSLIIPDPGRDAPMELDSLQNDTLVSPSAARPSSSVMISNPGEETLLELDSFLNDDSPLAAQHYSSAMISNHGQTELDAMMNEISTLLVSPSDTQPGRDAQVELNSGGDTSMIKRKSLLALATIAMNELIMLGQTNSPLWKIDSSSRRETLDYEEYRSYFNKGSVKHPGYVIDASRETGSVLMDSLALVNILTTKKWVNVFSPIVSTAATHRLTPKGSGGTRSGSLRMIEAEFQVISPLMPKRQVKFIRYCKMIRDGLWVIVDFTPRQENLNLSFNDGSNRLPSGVIIEACANGHSKVIWIEQTEYDESRIPQQYQLLISSGIGLGAKRWLTTLQRHCKNLSTLSTINLAEVYQGLSSEVATGIVKLAQRMSLNYYSGITFSPARKWKRPYAESERQNMRLMTRKNVDMRGEYTGIVLSAATSVWFPVSKKTMFDFLSDQSYRHYWDIFTTEVTSIEEKIKIQKSRIHANYVSFLEMGYGLSVLQETWNDASGALLVYAPLDTDSTEKILRGKNSDDVQILPSGFSILPDGGGETDPDRTCVGCLLTLGYQFLVNADTDADVDQDFVKQVDELMDHTIDMIKSAFSV